MQYKLLNHINSVTDLRKLNPVDFPQLAVELRDYIIDVVSTKKGHLGAGLGVVELSIALHYIFDTPEDLLVWDVGHQAYPHKILTSRKKAFLTNRQYGGIAGFPSREESEFDAFGTGHSSTAISAVLGMAYASKIKGENRKHIAVVGDASIASGMAFEALNHAGVSNTNILVILNDNQMGIDPHVGALKKYLTSIKSKDKSGQKNIFEALNFKYFGPVDGHDFEALLPKLIKLKNTKGPKLLHVITTKGKGLPQAERDQITYHAPGIFDKKTGLIKVAYNKELPPKYQDVFGLTLLDLAKKNEKIIGITAAMPTGTSLKYMLEALPDRAFDVGIAEQHAVTFAGGWATQGYLPYVAIYSTFLQRAYDQVIHDIALQNLPVVFCIDRAGLVGNDGATHHGVFDIAFLNAIPNMIVAAPRDEIYLRNLLYTAQKVNQPIAIRYPRGRGIHIDWEKDYKAVPIGKGIQLSHGKDIAILSVGPFGNSIQNILQKHQDWEVAHYDMLFVKPLDKELLNEIAQNHKTIITLEDGVLKGGFGQAVTSCFEKIDAKIKVHNLGIPDRFITHGSMDELMKETGLDEQNLEAFIKKIVG